MTRTVLALAALAALFCTSAGPKEGGAAADGDKIQGTWRFVSVLDQGKEQPTPEGVRLVVTSDTMKVVYPTKGDSMGWKYTIDPSKDPKEMDWSVEVDAGRPIHQPAIYSLEGDTLRICSAAAGEARPAAFESREGDSGPLWVLERVVPGAAREVAE